MNKPSEPWVSYGEPAAFGDWADVPGLTPGVQASLRRAEAQERAREQREAAERQARAEDRLEAWMARRHMELSAAGVPHNPMDPQSMAETPEQLAERVFAHQDAEARRAERRAAIESGLLHLLSVSPSEMAQNEVVLEPREEVEERAVRSELLTARRRTVLAKIRAAARRGLAHTGRPSQ